MLSKLTPVNATSSGRQEPEYIVRATGFDPEDGTNDLRPDICLYRSEDSNAFNLPDVQPDMREHCGKTAWAHIVSLIEINVNPSATPFNLDGFSFQVDNSSREEYIGLRASYVTEVYRRQHRTAVFTAFVFLDRVRFIRWDRAGALLSRTYNYVRDPSPFLQFFYLLAVSGPGDQGYSTEFKRVDGLGNIGLKLQAYQARVLRDEDPKNTWYRRFCRGLRLDIEKDSDGRPSSVTLDPLYAVRL